VGCELIVIGASWGGLTALERLLGGLPGDFQTPIAIAQHRAVDSGSGALAHMLSLRSGRDVCEAGDKDAIEQGRVYVAPPDYHLLVEPSGFALSTEGVVKYSRPSIDVLLDSAADTYGDRLIAVILTGANEDGAYGIKRVKRRGGVTIAQEPSGAERREMPEAAIATGAVDHVLPLEDIGPKLGELVGA
jgi:two-component system, chemotaxis family, protein-glutamate methylesterase/glutaminase